MQPSAQIWVSLQTCIENYIAGRKQKVGAFVHQHFSVKQVFKVQRKTFFLDILVNPLNMFWAIPFLFVRKGTEIFDKVGWSWGYLFLRQVPSGIKTNYQRHIDRMIVQDLLSWPPSYKNAFFEEVQKFPEVRDYLNSHPEILEKFRNVVVKEASSFSSSQALISDLSGSGAILAMGWYFFGDMHLTLMEMGKRIAKKVAYQQASSQFFLGRRIGSIFYKIAPPQPSNIQIMGSLAVILAIVAVVSTLFCLLSDPLRKFFGFQQSKLHSLLQHIEDRLFIEMKNEMKRSMG